MKGPISIANNTTPSCPSAMSRFSPFLHVIQRENRGSDPAGRAAQAFAKFLIDPTIQLSQSERIFRFLPNKTPMQDKPQ
jgi:hypothetical protein